MNLKNKPIDNRPIQNDLDEYGVWGIEAKDSGEFATIAAGIGMPTRYIDYCLGKTQKVKLGTGETITQTRPVAGSAEGTYGRMYEIDRRILQELKTTKAITKTDDYKKSAVKPSCIKARLKAVEI